MIVRLPSKIVFCKDCKRLGIIEGQKKMLDTHVLVCGCITKSGKREVMTKKRFVKIMRRLYKKSKKEVK